MLFYRKKLLLAVLEAFGGSVSNIKFQKYLFLVMRKLNKKHYHFVPYQYGCFSFESYNDKRSLNNYLKEDDKTWTLNYLHLKPPATTSVKAYKSLKSIHQDQNRQISASFNQEEKNNNKFLNEIHPKDREQILTVKSEYGNLSQADLLKKVYSLYPYYAINSQIIPQARLNPTEQKNIECNKPKQTDKCLFTIGYEGRSIDEYLNLLIKHNIKTLCDVRKTPLSRKYGFSKHSLQKHTPKLGIEYLHIPELGIHSGLRKNLNTNQDYKALFTFYKKQVLPNRKTELQTILTTLSKKKRIALMCFEADSNMCHRSCVSLNLKQINSKIEVKHL